MAITAPRPGTTTASAAWSLWALLLGVGLLMLGNGLMGSLLGMRAAEEAFGNTATGFIMSSYFVGFLAGSTLTPRKLREVGHIRVFAALASITSIAILVHVMVIDPWIWAGMRLVTGFAYAGLYVVTESWLNGYASNQLRGRLLAFYMVISYLGMGGGQLMLNLADPSGVILFLLVSILVSLALVPILLSHTPQPDTSQPESMSLLRLCRLSPLGTIGCLLTGIANGTVFGMGAVYATRSGMAVDEVAAFMGAFILGGALLQWPLGKLSDKTDRQKVIVVVAGLATLLALAGLTVDADAPLLRILLGAALGGTSLTLYSLCLATANDDLTSSQVIAASSSLVLALGIGATLGPVSTGLLMEWLGPGGFMWDMAAIHALLVAVGLYCLVRYPGHASETHGHYVAMPAGSAALGTTWAEEAANEAEQLELDLEGEPEAAACAPAESEDAWADHGAPRPSPL
ncbi:MFS transporter [Halomonas saccharevitans]|uniref:MFS transporter n=1 Tax=Halomonas saccharevitans TaxID=416872 RepID=A0A1I6XRD9_9GAMM|nr:MFS transporter [Halomonas saccharevitans]MDT8879625.1 MFS transporter [Halomonas saccharevitans]SFT40254.1 Predicted arabinose efflux permease, MFS family [Halomonas saccharevitans]